ncbi:hypothetical protein NPIL_275481 [Nephila pilipes]|uniref:Uncharacterized protein n=1 Tax=Nephila pilipes TaxID=299642 RepID=A0A8X6UD83_NEPPI|nr:hypothetical protein NPIL_275481 [Nephila pilipes]
MKSPFLVNDRATLPFHVRRIFSRVQCEDSEGRWRGIILTYKHTSKRDTFVHSFFADGDILQPGRPSTMVKRGAAFISFQNYIGKGGEWQRKE